LTPPKCGFAFRKPDCTLYHTKKVTGRVQDLKERYNFLKFLAKSNEIKLKRLNVDISMNCVLLTPLTTWAGFLGKMVHR
jgi:hypothetical protein